MPDMKRVGVLLVALAMTGCSGGGSTPPEASTTASSVTPSVSKSVSPSEDPLYLEAVEVYKKLLSEERKLMLAGGADELPDSMSELLVSPALQDLALTYKSLKSDGISMDPEPASTVTIEPSPGVKLGASVVSLASCEDGRKVKLRSTSGMTGRGTVISRKVYFERDASGSLRIANVIAEDIKSCG